MIVPCWHLFQVPPAPFRLVIVQANTAHLKGPRATFPVLQVNMNSTHLQVRLHSLPGSAFPRLRRTVDGPAWPPVVQCPAARLPTTKPEFPVLDRAPQASVSRTPIGRW